MKRITYSGGSLVTGNAITAALLECTTTVADAENSVTVDITILEDNGGTSVHALLLSPASQFGVADAGGIPEDEEADRFPVPDLPPVGIAGTVDSADQGAEDTADDVHALMRDIDHGSGER